jgi:hypothetical protein
MQLDAATKELILGIGAMSAILSAGVSGLIQLLNGWRDRSASNTRHIREMALQAAITQWQHDLSERAKAEARQAGSMSINPDPLPSVEFFDYILVKKLKLFQTFADGNIPTDCLPSKAAEIESFNKFFSPPRE